MSAPSKTTKFKCLWCFHSSCKQSEALRWDCRACRCSHIKWKDYFLEPSGYFHRSACATANLVRVVGRNGDPSSDPNAVERSITGRHSSSGAEAAKSENPSRSTQDGIECHKGEGLTKPMHRENSRLPSSRPALDFSSRRARCRRLQNSR